MADVLIALREPPRACSYLPDREASHDVRVFRRIAPAEFDALLARGWRRFGRVFFRPACAGCAECVGLRIPVAAFTASRSQRRARRLAARLDRVTGPPVADDERVQLYRRWHGAREVQRGWEASPMSADDYAAEFTVPYPFAREVAFRDPAHGGRLVGLGLVDVVPGALSAAIFFWDPDLAPPSLGVAHVVALVEQALAEGLRHLYLGFRVADCASMAYKARYRPHELLEGRPRDADEPTWRLADPPGAGPTAHPPEQR